MERVHSEPGRPLGLPGRLPGRRHPDPGRRPRRARPRGRRRAGRGEAHAPPRRAAAGRPRDLPRDLHTWPRVPRPVGRVPRDPARRRRRDGRRNGRRLPRPSVGPQARRSGSRGRYRHSLRRLHRPLQLPGPRRPRAPVLVLGGRHRDLDRRDDERDQPARRHGRARGGDQRHRRRDVRRPRPRAGPAGGRRALGDRRRRVPRLPAPQLLPRAHLHGGLRLAPARLRPRHRRDPGLPEDGRRPWR